MIALCEGKIRTIAWGDDPSGRYRGKEYFEELDIADKAKFEPIFRTLSEQLQMHNDTRFKKEGNGIFCMKAGPHRLACFFDEGDLVIVSGFQKKTRRDRRSKGNLERAARLRDEHFERKAGK